MLAYDTNSHISSNLYIKINETPYLIRWSDEIYSFHGRKRLTPLGYILNNWSKIEKSTFEPNGYIQKYILLSECVSVKLTCDSLRHNVCHFTAWWDHPHAKLVHHQNLRENSMHDICRTTRNKSKTNITCLDAVGSI